MHFKPLFTTKRCIYFLKATCGPSSGAISTTSWSRSQGLVLSTLLPKWRNRYIKQKLNIIVWFKNSIIPKSISRKLFDNKNKLWCIRSTGIKVKKAKKIKKKFDLNKWWLSKIEFNKYKIPRSDSNSWSSVKKPDTLTTELSDDIQRIQMIHVKQFNKTYKSPSFDVVF